MSTATSSPREKLINFVSPSSPFDKFILIAIVFNSIAIACVDYSHVDNNYQPSSETSIRNYVLDKFELVFTIIFTLECLLKCIAYGLWKGKQAYLRDGWNVLDFVIVIVSILALLPNVPNFSMLRSFRVLRPLRSLSKMPNLRKIIGGFIDSLPELANVMVLLLFILVCFALFGLTFWRGLYHSRCRLTPFPVKMPFDCRNATDVCWADFILDAVTNPEAHRCMAVSNEDSLWLSEPQDCIWPIDEEDTRICTLFDHGGHSCTRPTEISGTNISRTCGSNYLNGNPRFINSNEPYGFPRMNNDVFHPDFNWGFTSFDNFGSAFLTSFQVLTMEGWSDIMYRTIDAWSAFPTIMAFVALILVGSQLVINIMLAVITGSLDDMESEKAQSANYSSHGAESSKKKQKRQIQSAFIAHVQCLVQSKAYENFIFLVIILNTIVLSCDHYGINPEFQRVLDAGNFFTTMVFCIDMVLCNISYGVYSYWSTPSTFFDGAIALASAAELIVARTAANGSGGKSIMSVFRSLRLVRLLKMVQNWKSLHSLLNTISRAAADVRSFGVLLSLFVFIYALVGMQLFANRLHFDPLTGAHVDIEDTRFVDGSEIPRHNFDSLSAAVTLVFQILSGENWNEVMYDCWKARAWISPVYFMSLVVFGVFIVLNLFLAILLRQFEDNENDNENNSLPEVDTTESNSKSFLQAFWSRVKTCANAMYRFISSITQSSRSYLKIRGRCLLLVKSKRFEAALTVAIILSSIILALDNPLSDPTTPFARSLETINFLFTIIFVSEFLIKIIGYGPVGYFSDTWNILDFSSVTASLLEILNMGGGKSLRAVRTMRVLRPLKMVNRFPEIKLVVDALLSSLPSVVNVGLICGMLFLTFAIFGVTFLKGTFYHCNDSSLTIDQMELVTYPIAYGNLAENQLTWLSIEANDCAITEWDAEYTPSSKEFCLCLGSQWDPTIPQNFDNVLRGFALLFEISSTEGWVDVMYAAIDQRGIDMQPVRGSSEIWAIYFILFLVLGAFFLLELFVGVIVENFARMKEIKGCGLMTAAQKEWALAQSLVMKIKPEKRFTRPKARYRAVCFDLVMPHINPWFDRFILVVIIINTACLAAAGYGDSTTKIGYLELINETCSAIFILEAFMKITAFGAAYFRSLWNRFDCSIAIGLVIGFVLKHTITNDRLANSISSVISLLRIGRLIRLVRLVKSLRTIVNSIVTAIPGILNIGGLLVLLFFVYSVIGMQLYGMIAFQGELNEHANFRSIGNAMLLLFRFSTGENWNGFMWDLVKARPDCDPDPTYNKSLPWCIKEDDYYPNCTEVNGCGAGPSVFPFFYSFILIVGLVVLNMFVGVVLEAFENSQESDIMNPEDLDHFVTVWAEYDPDARGAIKASDIASFLRKLKPPLGLGVEETDKGDLYFKDQSLLEIAVNDKKEVNIVNVARQVAKRLVKAKQGDKFIDLSNDHPVHRRMMKQKEEMKMTLGDVYMNDARVILKAVRRFKQRLAARTAKQATIFPES